MNQENIKRFTSLFRGNKRSYGRFYPDNGKVETIKESAPTEEDFKNHLEGSVGIGIVPISDDNYCYFGAIDIDAHGDSPNIDLMDLESKVREHDLPLMVCRSKSGGAHLYLFGSEPLKASLVRTALAKWAEVLGYSGVEVFPKQNQLLKNEDGTQQLGNWINLCYFDAENPDQLRYSLEGGKVAPIEYFLDLAESRKVTASILVEKSDTAHNGAPPCIQKIISNGVPAGKRNEAMYNLVIYLKQAYPESWKDKAFDLNAKIFDVPLAHSEAKKTINSAGRRDYRYKCKEEPCRSLCNSHICVNRKYGRTPDEKSELSMGKPPKFDNLRKLTTEPVKWLLRVDDKDIVLTTIELMDYRKVREAVADKLTKLIAPMKNDQWQSILHPLMEMATIIEAPDEASTSGIVRAKLQSFIKKADLNQKGNDQSDRDLLLTGVPVVQLRDKLKVVYFRGQDFVDFLKKNRSEELKGSNLWMALRDSGIGHCKLRVKGSSIQVWYVPISDNNAVDLGDVEIKNDF